jgi:hypothetical protein
VRAGLAADQGIDPPAAIQPDHQPGSFEVAEDLLASGASISITAAVNRGTGTPTNH